MNDEKMLRKIHFTMAVIGGFIGVYGILIRQDLFGNSQTSNVIFIVISILGRNIFDFITRFFALLKNSNMEEKDSLRRQIFCYSS